MRECFRGLFVVASVARWYPRQESNLRTWFRKPLLYPLSYGGTGVGGGGRPPGNATCSVANPPGQSGTQMVGRGAGAQGWWDGFIDGMFARAHQSVPVAWHAARVIS